MKKQKQDDPAIRFADTNPDPGFNPYENSADTGRHHFYLEEEAGATTERFELSEQIENNSNRRAEGAGMKDGGLVGSHSSTR